MRLVKRTISRLAISLCLILGTSPALGQSEPQVATVQYSANVQETTQRPNLSTVQIRVYGGRPSQAGAGVIVSFDGFVVTAAHVVNGFQQIRVTTADGATYRGSLVDLDAKMDLALVKINPSAPLKSAVLASYSTVKAGAPIVVVGNPLGMGQSVTAGKLGTVSLASHNGHWAALQKMSAHVQPGNSGGGAFHAETGELLGVVLAKSDVKNRTGYMMPVQRVVAFLERKTPLVQLTDSQKVYERLGIRFRAVRLLSGKFQCGLLLTHVRANSAAALAGWQTGDVLVGLDEYQMINADAIAYVLRQSAANQESSIAFQLERGDELARGTVQLVTATATVTETAKEEEATVASRQELALSTR